MSKNVGMVTWRTGALRAILSGMELQRTERVGYIAFDGIQGLDLLGPLEAFQEANELSDRQTVCYENIVISETGGPVVSSSGVTIAAHASIDDHPPLDTLIIPGGEGARRQPFSRDLLTCIHAADRRTRRTASICTGLFILAQTGLLDGHVTTTHWRHVHEAAERFPQVRVTGDDLFRNTGKYYTAAGVTSGIDLSLAFIEQDYGPELAKQVARNLVVFLRRPGDQRQFSSPLQAQMAAPDDFAELVAWVADHLSEDLDAFTLAERVGLSERQFRRRFAQIFGQTPVKFIERARVESACAQLSDTSETVEVISRLVGFASADVFRRAFERVLGLSPLEYRHRFSHDAERWA